MSKNLAQKQNEMELQKVEWDLHEVEEAKPLEFTEENNINAVGIPLTVQETALKGLMVYLAERDLLDKEFEYLSKQEVTPENIKQFKELRLKYVRNRTQGTNKWHEKESEVSLRYKQFLDAKKRSENAINESREDVLMAGEKFFENQEKEKKRLINLERIEKIRPYIEDITGLDFSEMNDYDFEDYVLGKKTRFENEKAEKERLEKEAEEARLAEIERQKAIEIENSKLKAEAEAKAVLRNERSKLLQPYIVFIRDYNSLIDKEENEFQKELSEIKIGAEQQWQFELDERNKKARIEFEQQELQRKEFEKATEIRLKKEAESKAENERLANEKAEKLETEKLAKAPIKKQLSVWVESFELPTTTVSNETTLDIIAKYEAFKKWAQTQITNL